MYKEILVQSNTDEAQVAVLENGQLVEIYIEPNRSARLAGGIFKGQVENVLPGMQAAFVDIGEERNAFLYVEEAVPDNTYGHNGLKPNILEILKKNQEIAVQVLKEPVGKKGARVTRQLTLPGRFLVLMPTVDYIGVSRKITSDEERERLRSIVNDLRPEKTGVIVRTVAEGIDREHLEEDLKILLELWEDIKKRKQEPGVPKILHKDLGLVERTIRDLVNDDVKKITFNNYYNQKKVQELIGDKYEVARNIISLSSSYDILSSYNIKQEIKRALNRKVWLKSGGYLIIDQTEALTVIDVNTGKFVGKTSLEETVLKTNLEAAVEIARQLRLRNIGGIIIIDFIDLEEKENESKIIASLEDELEKDKTKSHVLGMTSLGLLEMTRKKTGFTLASLLEKQCPSCLAKGRIISEKTVCSLLKNELWEIANRSTDENLSIQANPKIISLLRGRDNKEIKRITKLLKKNINLIEKNDFSLEEYEINILHN